MTFERYPNRAKSGWEKFLTAPEAEEIAKIDEEATRLDMRRRQLTNERRTIQNRATQRALARKRAAA